MTSTPNANPGATIMVVDDTPANLQLLTGLLQTRGYRVRPVPSGELALEAFRREVPELVLLDINMPGMNGYEVCERFKRDPLSAAVPVIFLSALSETTDKVKGFKLGAVDYITKPFQFEEVESRVSTHLELARLRQQLERHNEQLEEQVRQRTAKLAEAHARLAILDKAKSDFLSLISHELRTPLCGVFGVVELMLHQTSDREKKEEYMEIYQRSRRRLLTLIDDALLLSEIDSGALNRKQEECSLDRLLLLACSQAEPFLRFRQVQTGPPLTNLGSVSGSPDHLVRALRSLLETAVKFAKTWSTPSPGQTPVRERPRFGHRGRWHGHPAGPAAALLRPPGDDATDHARGRPGRGTGAGRADREPVWRHSVGGEPDASRRSLYGALSSPGTHPP